jgi:uncharacterized coiled-coil DUF342 family protein
MPTLDHLLQRVRRRLFLQTLVSSMLPCAAGALLAAAVWFVVQPILWAELPLGWKWGVGGILFGAGLLAAVMRARWRAPSLVAAALAMDDKFGLKERVTTLLTLSADQLASPAGAALRIDVDQSIAALDPAGKFPLRVSWRAAMVPVGAALLAVAASFFEPFWSAEAGSTKTVPAATAKEIQHQLDNLKKVSLPKLDEQLQKEDLRELENAWDKLVKQPPPKTEDQIRERVKEMRDIQDKLNDRIKQMKDLAARNKDIKSQLQKLDADPKSTKEMRDLEDALAKGKLDKAMDALERLAKRLDDKKLSKEEQKQLADQLDALKEKLERLANQKEKKDKLKKDFENGKITKQELEREMDRMAQEAENMKDLQELAELLGQCKGCLGKGGAGAKLRKLAGKLKAIELTDEELRALLESQQALEDAGDALLLALNEGDGEGDGDMDGDEPGNGMGAGRRAGRRRPVGEDPKNSQTVNARQHAETDPRAQHHITGFTKGGIFSRVPAREVGGAFKQAVQDAPDAIDRQRIPPDASDMAKGYFKNLGGQR